MEIDHEIFSTVILTLQLIQEGKLSVSNEKFWWFHISAQNIGGSNEYPQSMFLSRNKKINVYPYKPQFYYIKVGFKGVKTI